MNLVLEVQEHGRIPVSDAVAGATPPDFWEAADCEVTRSVADGSWILKAGNSVGVARVVTAIGEVALQVRPKLDTADVFFMADYAYEQRHEPLRLLDSEDVDLQAALQDPTACLLVWHARAVRRFAARWLRRDYQKVTRVLNGTVKGKILVGRYVTNHLALGDGANVPCRVQERTQDTPNNRVLKAGLRFIAGMSHNLPVPAAQRAVLREVNAALPLFSQVSDIRVSPNDIRETSARGPFRHYEAVLRATISLLDQQLAANEIGGSHTTSAFMWQMPTLFQEFVRGLIGSTPDLTLRDDGPGRARILDSAGKQWRRPSKVDPDLILRSPAGSTLLVDTKYKDVLPSAGKIDNTSIVNRAADGDEIALVADRHRIKVAPSDIYQVIAYRQHERWPRSTAALLYPLVLAPGDPLPAPLEVHGFGSPVFLLFIDIGRNARANVPSFVETVRGFLVDGTSVAS